MYVSMYYVAILSINVMVKVCLPRGEDLHTYFHQSIQYSYKVGKYCIKSSSPERLGIYFSGLQFHPCNDLLPQEKSPTAGLKLTTFRSICHMQICDYICVAAASVFEVFEVAQLCT
jgi:hypothetical protein